uniref:Uncharacterized protein n=1 Tax=Vespula pensylvanica TaxID=30213 RepID=A0A834P9T8_VESPE|nr:hypothetical protein H0235_005219 [Vespula pensylvanica]
MNRRRRSGGGEEVEEEEDEEDEEVEEKEEVGFSSFDRRREPGRINCISSSLFRGDSQCRPEVARPGPSGDLERQREALRGLKGHSNGGKAMELLVKRERNTTGDYLLPRPLRFLRGAQ